MIEDRLCRRTPEGLTGMPVPEPETTVSLKYLAKIKSSKVYAKACRIALPSGWTACVDRFDMRRTYLSMLDGLPDRRALYEEIESARHFVKDHFGGPTPVVIPPKLYDPASDSPILPALRFAAQICSIEPLTDGPSGSWMNLIWFAEIDDKKTIKAFVEDALRAVEWEA